ncbi:alpha/beta hydrolase-fold protein [Acinetobacter shaoyimingii]|uniref:DUF3327 domain-containing protein n=1 Tax=Acinetobacter shaoyimingii TaxID=2715164 RepID=A0A6G8RW73_9GAMM|nr:alpha/beta hydrolase-fold protein [Acinetobacter shaoyimingii]QIO06135.1 DUF3327 domain-containing protein [Acinetobacter shaoyimingii]
MDNNEPIHPLLQCSDRGSPAWWEQILQFGNPLITIRNGKSVCTFVWQKTSAEVRYVLIDIYSQSPSIYEQWNILDEIEGTDICTYTIELPKDWFGSYVIIETAEQPPAVTAASIRRQWWIAQLQQFAQKDPLNPYPAYSGQIARFINQIHSHAIDDSTAPLHSIKTMNWHSSLLHNQIAVEWLSIAEDKVSEASTAKLILCLDGNLWSQLQLFQKKMIESHQQGSIHNCLVVFIACTTETRALHYGCHDLFCHALVQELIPLIHQHFQYLSFDETMLCGQSMGGLCAVYCCLLYPNQFDHVISQSGSYWWSDFSNSQFHPLKSNSFLHLMDTLLQDKSQPLLNIQTKIHISAGHCETDMKQHSEDLHQLLSSHQLSSSHHLFYGGHDPIHWQADLLTTLEKLLSKTTEL